MKITILVPVEDDSTDGDSGSIDPAEQVEQNNTSPGDLGFVEFLSVPGIIETSEDEFGMLLPIETRDRIVAEIIARILDKSVVKGDQLKSLTAKIRDHFDKSKVWRSYFDILCKYKDFINAHSDHGNQSAKIRQETRGKLELDQAETEEYEKIKIRLSLTTKVFARFVTDTTYHFIRSLPGKAPENFQKNS